MGLARMNDLSDRTASGAPVRSLPLRLRDARRARGLTQAEVARQAGCLQSQVSMLERGQPNRVARETLEKIAALLEVDLGAAPVEAVAPAVPPPPAHAYCPQAECPSNTPYCVGGELFFWPSPQPGSARPGHRCAWCGEVLAFVCPQCGAAAGAGACCRECGAPLVAPPPGLDAAPEPWAERRRQEIETLRALR
jgi:transcriptional regulator with XRE-family HTH domain